MVEHGAVANQLGWLHDVHGLGPGSVVLQKTPLSFDAAQWEVLAPACGATVVAGTPGLHRDPDRLVDTIVRHRVTTLQCVPTLLRALVDGGRATECTSLRQICSGGETLTRSLADECLREVPWAELVNLYGPTECTINASAHVVSREELLDGPPAVPLGIPAHGTYFRVLDERCAPVSPGEIGELAEEGFEAFYAEDRYCYLRHIGTGTTSSPSPNPHRPSAASSSTCLGVPVERGVRRHTEQSRTTVRCRSSPP